MSHTVNGQTTSYTWDVAASLPVVLKDNTYTYVYGLDLISAMDSGGNQNYYMYNGLGSVTNIADYNGDEKALHFYDAFGNPRYAVELTSNVWRYTGEQRDADSGLYYLRARYYDPGTGRFLGRDPAGAGHPYAYVENNPVNFIDPSGLLFHKKAWDCAKDPIDCGEDVAEVVIDATCNPYVAAVGCAAIGAAGDIPWEDLGYVDINGTVCIYLCLTGGLQASFGQGLHPYAGTGLGYGAGVSATVAPGQAISTGWNCALQGSYGFLAAQVGAGIDIKEGGLKLAPWVEVGVTLAVGTPTYTCYYVW